MLALWQPARLDERRALRGELIDVLLTRGATDRALAEVLKLSGEIPDEAADHVRVGQLLLRAGSPARAEAQFAAALRRAPHDMAALAGAGAAAFAAGDYEHARDFLSRIPGGADNGTLRLAELVIDMDPLQPRLTARERDRRLARAVDALADRAAACSAARTRAPDTGRSAADTDRGPRELRRQPRPRPRPRGGAGARRVRRRARRQRRSIARSS